MRRLPTYLARHLSADQLSLSLTALPYVANSLFAIGAGHLADYLSGERAWSLLAVRRLLTFVGLIGPALCLLVFSQLSNLGLAVM